MASRENCLDLLAGLFGQFPMRAPTMQAAFHRSNVDPYFAERQPADEMKSPSQGKLIWCS